VTVAVMDWGSPAEADWPSPGNCRSPRCGSAP